MGYVFKHRTHGYAPHKPGTQKWRTYTSYRSAKGRCLNKKDPSYERYGGSGVKFKFRNFLEFLKELGERPTGMTLDRYPKSNGNYESGNVRWATVKQQAQNRDNRKGKPWTVARQAAQNSRHQESGQRVFSF
jgi:hypothetical protein